MIKHTSILLVTLYLIICTPIFSQDSKSSDYFGTQVRWITACEYDISLDRCTSNDVGEFLMVIEKYPNQVGSLTVNYKGLLKFDLLDISFSDPDNYILKLSDKNSKRYKALLSLDYIPGSRVRMYTKFIISDDVEALVFETDMNALDYMTKMENELNSFSKSRDSTSEERRRAIANQLPDSLRNLSTGFSDPSKGKLQSITYVPASKYYDSSGNLKGSVNNLKWVWSYVSFCIVSVATLLYFMFRNKKPKNN